MQKTEINEKKRNNILTNKQETHKPRKFAPTNFYDSTVVYI